MENLEVNFYMDDILIHNTATIDGISVFEYFKDKPIDYKGSIDIISPQEARNLKWLRDNNTIACDAVALVGTCHMNPYFHSGILSYIESQGYKIIPGDGLPTTGAAVICLIKN